MNIDLHTHSLCSDGTLAPAELVASAVAAGVEVLALTDHDTTDGLDEAGRAAAQTPLKLIPGTEISATWRAQTIHVLGLWIDPTAPLLAELLQAQRQRRQLRMQAICARLAKAGLPGEDLLRAVQAQAGLPTRTHLAAALVAGGHVGRTAQAFRKYLGRGCPGHVAADWPPLIEVVAAVTAAGGSASLAHPLRYALSAGARRQLLADFSAAGGTALEVVSGGNGLQHADACASLAVRFGLAGSVGSDFHGPQMPWNPLGRLAKLPEHVKPVWNARAL